MPRLDMFSGDICNTFDFYHDVYWRDMATQVQADVKPTVPSSVVLTSQIGLSTPASLKSAPAHAKYTPVAPAPTTKVHLTPASATRTCGGPKTSPTTEPYHHGNKWKRLNPGKASLHLIKKDTVQERALIFSGGVTPVKMSGKPSVPPPPKPTLRKSKLMVGSENTSVSDQLMNTNDGCEVMKPDRPPPPCASLKPKISDLKPAIREKPARNGEGGEDSVSNHHDAGKQPRTSVLERSKLFNKMTEDSTSGPRPIKPAKPLSPVLTSVTSVSDLPARPKPPHYARLDADKKRKSQNTPNIIIESQPGNTYDGVVVLSTSPDEAPVTASPEPSRSPSKPGPPTPPVKPPRTFKHDEYVQTKADKREGRKKRKQLMSGGGTPLDHVYEEIETEPLEGGDLKISLTTNASPSKDRNRPKFDTIRPGGKLPPPPRPPRPSSLDGPPADISIRDNPHKDHNFVQVNKHNTSLGKDSFVKASKISNPGYGRSDAEVIPIHSADSLKRCKSDEYLYVDDTRQRTLLVEPIYQDPVDVMRPRAVTCIVSPHGVSIDPDGYAIPDSRSHTLNRQRSIPGQVKPRGYGTLAHREPRKYNQLPPGPSHVRNKVSRAYSILRPLPPTDLTDSKQKDEIDDSDTEVDEKVHKRRLDYVNSVKNKTYEQVQIYSNTIGRVIFKKLFDYCMVVGLELPENKNQYIPKVLFKFPGNVAEDVNSISAFCFPDAAVWRPVSICSSETFWFVLTRADGTRSYGYCRRVLPPGSGNRLPEVYCVVSSLGVFPLFENLLLGAEKKRQVSLEAVENLLKASYAKPLPPPGKEAWIRSPGAGEKMETLILKRPMDLNPTTVQYDQLMTRLTMATLLKVFSSILLERRVIFIAQHLSTLSHCIHSIQSLLYPFSWQHTFIPVLPGAMIEVVCAPTPYIIGVLTSLQPRLKEFDLEEVLLVDLDTGAILQSQGDESDIIPRKLQKALTAAVKDDADSLGSRDAVIAEAFIRLFVETVGHYTEYICTQQDSNLIFQKEAFVKAVSSKSIRMFLEWFSETQMFEVFITNAISDGPTNWVLFDTRVEEYREEMQLSNTFTKNVKQVGRKMINFFIESGDRLKKKLGAGDNVFV